MTKIPSGCDGTLTTILIMLEENEQELDETKTSLNSFNNSLTTTQEELNNLKELAAATKSTIFYSFLFYG